jgi:alkyl-hydroperoxide reductase/thiol specific antioxidant family protein
MGGKVVAVSVGHRFQAEALTAAGFPFPLLTDPERQIARNLGVRGSLLGVLNPLGWWRYLRLMLRGQRPRLPSLRGIVQMPGLAIVDADGRALFVHRGRSEGDYPPVSSVLDRLRALA